MDSKLNPGSMKLVENAYKKFSLKGVFDARLTD